MPYAAAVAPIILTWTVSPGSAGMPACVASADDGAVDGANWRIQITRIHQSFPQLLELIDDIQIQRIRVSIGGYGDIDWDRILSFSW